MCQFEIQPWPSIESQLYLDWRPNGLYGGVKYDLSLGK